MAARSTRRLLVDAWRRLRGGELTPLRVAASVGIGGFIGCLPVYGLHWLLCLAVCLPLRLDAVLAYLAANVSNPVLAPLILALEVQVGAYVVSGKSVALVEVEPSWEFVGQLGANLVVGSLIVGVAVGALFAVTGYAVSGYFGSRATRSPGR